jgi:hypothetical protein
MAKRPAKPAPLPPPTARACWTAFLKGAVGIPLVVLAALGLIAGALWLSPLEGMMWRTVDSLGTALLWVGLIVLMYPLLLWFWVEDLRAGLKAARDWDALAPEARAAALAAAPVRKRARG